MDRLSKSSGKKVVDLTREEESCCSDEILALMLQEELFREGKPAPKKIERKERSEDELLAMKLQFQEFEEVPQIKKMKPDPNAEADEALARMLEKEEAEEKTRNALAADPLLGGPPRFRPTRRSYYPTHNPFSGPPFASAELLSSVPFFITPRSSRHFFGPTAAAPDDLSYEQCLALEEKMGKVKVGLNRHQRSQLPMKIIDQDSEENCTICYDNFKKGEKAKSLPCNHQFHVPCIDKWLDGSKKCPTCMREVQM